MHGTQSENGSEICLFLNRCVKKHYNDYKSILRIKTRENQARMYHFKLEFVSYLSIVYYIPYVAYIFGSNFTYDR
jgi:hypothetical protein